MRVFGRYLLFQAASWALGALVLGGLVYGEWMPVWVAGLLLATLLLKDLVMFPFVRKAYEPSASHGGESLLGAIARVEQSLTPEGWIRVGPESWRARAIDGSSDLRPGDYVEVREIDDLVLLVEPHISVGEEVDQARET
jgi:membrane protein implicated in regulation of membrane protease activity